MPESNSVDRLREAILEGDESSASRAAAAALEAGVEPARLIEEAINRSLDEIGKAFQNGDVFLPELMMVGDAARAATDMITPHVAPGDRQSASRGTVVIGTIQGDLHDIGKNIVSAYMAASGLRVRDLGTDVPPKRFVEAASEEKARFIAVSTLLTTTMPFFKDLTHLLRDVGLRESVFVLVGGGPVTPEWASETGADGYGRDAKDAVDLCERLLEGSVPPPLPEPLVLGALRH
jgi:corrinoid protein of di/trimethylamine methyltransferase